MNQDHVRTLLACARDEWCKNIHEAPGNGFARIRQYLFTCGFGTWQEYDSDGDAEWCGAFATFCLVRAGANRDILRQKSPPELGGLGSTYRMHCLARLPVGSTQAARYIPPTDVQPGDILSLGRTGAGRPPCGEHIVILAGIPAGGLAGGKIETLEGNATGLLGDGTQGQGVITRTRFVKPSATEKGIIFGLRLLDSDFGAPLE